MDKTTLIIAITCAFLLVISIMMIRERQKDSPEKTQKKRLKRLRELLVMFKRVGQDKQ